MSIKTGNKKIRVDQGMVKIKAENDFTVTINDFVIPSSSRTVEFDVTEDDVEVEVKVGSGVHWSLEHQSRKWTEKLSQVPVEIPDNLRREETLQQKMERFIVGAMEERFGAGKVETMAESIDFDLDDDGELPLSKYEVVDMPEEFPVRFDDERSESSNTNPPSNEGTPPEAPSTPQGEATPPSP